MEVNNDNAAFLKCCLDEQYEQDDVNRIYEGYIKKRPVTLRVNTLKSNVDMVKSKLVERGIKFQEVPWSETALIIENSDEKGIQEMDIYINGEIYLQSLSSMLPPIILNPKPDEDILDMAAAPGGKTTQIAALTQNNAHITACEMNALRVERLKYNVEKQGASSSVYVMQKDSRNIDDFFSFDRILLDAPCSGSGTLSLNEKDTFKYFSQKLVEKSAKSQLALLKKALKILKPGCEMVYSTCSILEKENEEIIRKVIENEKAEIIPINLDQLNGLPLLPVKIKGTVCVCPNELYEGFFIARIRKL